MKPYALTTSQNAPLLDLDLGFAKPVEVFEISDPAHATFCQILNEGNQLAFGGEKSMGMPLWVMLDCAILPGAMLGFMAQRSEIDAGLAERLKIPDGYHGPIPISEYSACPAIEPGTVSGFSLQTQIENRGLGTQTKALALAALRAKKQVGVTQFDNPAIRVHSRFGRLEVLVHRPIVHTHAQNSFVYAVELPDRSTLLQLAHGVFAQKSTTQKIDLEFDPGNESHHQKVSAHLRSGGRVWIERPGWRTENSQVLLPMTLD